MVTVKRVFITVSALTLVAGQLNRYLQRRKRKEPIKYTVLKVSPSETSNKRTVAVLGGTGYVGSHVVDQLVESGEYCVYVLGRTFRDDGNNVQALIRVDFTDREGLCRAFAGVDSVIHTAAVLPNAFTTPKDILLGNQNAARNVVSAAQQMGVRNLVYVTGVDTKDPAKNSVARAMFESFQLATDVIISANGQQGLRTTSLRYGGMYGLRDPMWEGIMRGDVHEVPYTASEGTVIPVKYVANSIVKAEQKLSDNSLLVAGHALKIPGERMAFRDFFVLPQWGHEVHFSFSVLPKVKAHLNVLAIALLGWAPFGPGSCPVMHCTTAEEVLTDDSFQEVLGIPPVPGAAEGVAQLVKEFKTKEQ